MNKQEIQALLNESPLDSYGVVFFYQLLPDNQFSKEALFEIMTRQAAWVVENAQSSQPESDRDPFMHYCLTSIKVIIEQYHLQKLAIDESSFVEIVNYLTQSVWCKFSEYFDGQDTVDILEICDKVALPYAEAEREILQFLIDDFGHDISTLGEVVGRVGSPYVCREVAETIFYAVDQLRYEDVGIQPIIVDAQEAAELLDRLPRISTLKQIERKIPAFSREVAHYSKVLAEYNRAHVSRIDLDAINHYDFSEGWGHGKKWSEEIARRLEIYQV